MRATRIRERDGNRCRGCHRHAEEVRLEVHHRRYGSSGPCGSCRLLGVADDDLTSLCTDCHDAITSVRRRLRYGEQRLEAVPYVLPDAAVVVRIRRDEIEADIEVPEAKRVHLHVRRRDPLA